MSDQPTTGAGAILSSTPTGAAASLSSTLTAGAAPSSTLATVPSLSSLASTPSLLPSSISPTAAGAAPSSSSYVVYTSTSFTFPIVGIVFIILVPLAIIAAIIGFCVHRRRVRRRRAHMPGGSGTGMASVS